MSIELGSYSLRCSIVDNQAMLRAAVIFLSLALPYAAGLYALGWQYHSVRPGDSLEKIARRYSVTVTQLAQWNNLSDTNSIFIGQRLKILRESGFVAAAPEEDRPGFTRPVTRWKVVRSYSASVDEPHYGVLVRTEKGASIRAAESGVVARVGPVRGYGVCIFVDHGGGWLTMYSHLTDIKVRPGDKIRKQTEIGEAGEGKMFFTVSYGGKPLNPLELL